MKAATPGTPRLAELIIIIIIIPYGNVLPAVPLHPGVAGAVSDGQVSPETASPFHESGPRRPSQILSPETGLAKGRFQRAEICPSSHRRERAAPRPASSVPGCSPSFITIIISSIHYQQSYNYHYCCGCYDDYDEIIISDSIISLSLTKTGG